MTHNEPRVHWLKEGAISFGAGVLYGTSYVAVAHPFDTIKTKMQAQTGFEKFGIWKTFSKTFKAEGVVGLYRGCVPPLWGSAIYRSVQFAAFEAAYTLMDNDICKTEIPLTFGLQIRVILGGIISGSIRSIVECPLEYAKIKRQIGQTWHVNELFNGYRSLLIRSAPLLTSYFIIVDSMRRNRPDWFTYPVFGPLFTSGFAATAAWWTVWPLEFVRTQLQAGYGDMKESTFRRLGHLYRDVGFFGLYRGILPGSLRAFTGAGAAMVVMQEAQKKATEWGWRDQ